MQERLLRLQRIFGFKFMHNCACTVKLHSSGQLETYELARNLKTGRYHRNKQYVTHK